jgi:hypothetical protein
VDEVCSRQPEAVSQRVVEAPPLDEDAGDREPEEREPAERDEVDTCEDEHAGGRERQEGDGAGQQRAPHGIPPAGRERHRPDIAQPERERPHHEPVPDARAPVEERRADGECGRRNPEAEPAPEPMPVKLDRVAD